MAESRELWAVAKPILRMWWHQCWYMGQRHSAGGWWPTAASDTQRQQREPPLWQKPPEHAIQSSMTRPTGKVVRATLNATTLVLVLTCFQRRLVWDCEMGHNLFQADPAVGWKLAYYLLWCACIHSCHVLWLPVYTLGWHVAGLWALQPCPYS